MLCVSIRRKTLLRRFHDDRLLLGLFPKQPQTVYCWGSHFSLNKCPPLSMWWCPALQMRPCPAPDVCLHLSPSLLSSLVSLRLSPGLAGGVRLFGCLSSLVFLHLSASVAGGARLSGYSCLWMSAFACLPSCVSGSGWWCPALRMFVFTCVPSFVVVSGSLEVCLRLSPFFCLRCGWWCPGPLDVCLHLSPPVCLPVCCLHLFPFIGFPLWLVNLVVSGSSQ